MKQTDKYSMQCAFDMLRDVASGAPTDESVPFIRDTVEWIAERTETEHDWAETIEWLRLTIGDMTQLHHIRDKVLQAVGEWMDWKAKVHRNPGK